MTRRCTMCSPPSSLATSKAADNDAEQRDNAINDRLADRGNTVDDGHDDRTNGGENGLELRESSVYLLLQLLTKKNDEVMSWSTATQRPLRLRTTIRGGNLDNRRK